MNKHYCCTDFHGNWELWEQISTYCDDTDVIYFLGDAIDRGPDGIKIMESLLTDNRVIYLLGNHEEFLINAAPKLINKKLKHLESIDDENIYVWLYNGGYNTAKDFIKSKKEKQLWLIQELKKLREVEIYTNTQGQCINLSHAGTDFNHNKYFNGSSPYIWDRSHIYTPWSKKFHNVYVVHGHTPVQYLWKDKIVQPSYRIIKNQSYPSIARYADGHKFDLDLGTYNSKTVVLFDLDTLDVAKYFEVKRSIYE